MTDRNFADTLGTAQAAPPRHAGARVTLGENRVTATLPTVCVTLPVYNEAGLIERTFHAVAAFAANAPNYHFLFVDDGSKDDTASILRRLVAATGLANVELYCQPSNGGKARAIKAGVSRCEADLFLFTDGDLAYPLDHLPLLVKALETSDVAIGSRALVPEKEKNTKVLRRILGWGFNKIARIVIGVPYRDTQAGLKGFRAAAAREIFKRQHITGFEFDVEVVFLAKMLRYRISEIPAHVSDAHSYKISKVNLVRDPLRMFGGLWRIRMNHWRGRYA